jgi:lanosterol synthase
MSQKNSSWNNWQLLTEKGRQIWAYKPASQDINAHLHNANNFSEQELQAFAKDFSFDRQINPSASDKVFRQQYQKNNAPAYSGTRPKAKSAEEQKLIDSLINGMHYFSRRERGVLATI